MTPFANHHSQSAAPAASFKPATRKSASSSPAVRDNLRFDGGKLHDVFDKYSIANTFEIYHGTHTSAVADRFQNHVLPFFSKNLCSTNSCN
jgi:hypothetical protein